MSPVLTRRGLVRGAGAAIGATVAGMPVSARAYSTIRTRRCSPLSRATLRSQRSATPIRILLRRRRLGFRLLTKPFGPAALTETFGDVVSLGASADQPDATRTRIVGRGAISRRATLLGCALEAS